MIIETSRHPRAFTFVELIIVITIMGIIALVAMNDYGFSIKKARLQVAASELATLLQDTQVLAQTDYHEEDPMSGDDYVICFAVVVSQSDEPMLYQVNWDEEDEVCSSDLGDWSEGDVFNWNDLISVTRIDWETIDTSGSTNSGSENELAFSFNPVSGDISIFTSPSSQPTLLTDVSQVEIQIAHDLSTEEVLNKTIRVVPVTSSFLILSGDGSST